MTDRTDSRPSLPLRRPIESTARRTPRIRVPPSLLEHTNLEDQLALTTDEILVDFDDPVAVTDHEG